MTNLEPPIPPGRETVPTVEKASANLLAGRLGSAGSGGNAVRARTTTGRVTLTRRYDHHAERVLAEATGPPLLEIRETRTRLVEGSASEDGRGEADRRSHEHLVAPVRRESPGDAALTGGAADHVQTFEAERTSGIDPLDGLRTLAT